MLSLGWPELLIIGVVAVLAIGPKELPRAFRTLAQVVRQARGLAREFQQGLASIAHEAELQEIRDTMQDLRDIDRPETRRPGTAAAPKAEDPADEQTGSPPSAPSGTRPPPNASQGG